MDEELKELYRILLTSGKVSSIKIQDNEYIILLKTPIPMPTRNGIKNAWFPTQVRLTPTV
jgi:hypothetical protein